jgi:hypothetical protein
MDTIWRSSSFDNFVTNLPIIMLKAQSELPPDMVRSLFQARPWKRADGDRVTFDSYALPQYGERADGELGSFPLLGIEEGDPMTVRHNQYVGKMAYTLRMETFDKEQLAEQFARTVIHSINNALDLEMTHKVLSDAEDSTYTPRNKSTAVDWVCADNVALAGTHTVNSGDTFSTEYTTAGAYSTETITAMKAQALGDHCNDAGQPVDLEFDTVMHGPNPYMIKKSFEIFGTPLDPGTALNAVNIYRTKWNKKIVVLNKAQVSADGKTYRTTDTAAYRYALLDSRYGENWQYQVANEPTIVLKDTDIDTVLKVILGSMFCAYATVRAQGYMLHRQNVAKPTVTD